MRLIRLSAAHCATTTLLACNTTTMSQTNNLNNGHPSGPSPVDDRINGQIADFDAMAHRLENGGIPLDSDVPDTGHVTYAGFGAIYIDGHPDDGYLIGDAEVRADFVSSAFEGEVTDMAGTVNGQASVARSGTLELSGEVGLADTAGLEGTVNGSLSAGSDHLSIHGPISGFFQGSPVTGLSIRTADGVTTILNGENVSGSVAVIAEH